MCRRVVCAHHVHLAWCSKYTTSNPLYSVEVSAINIVFIVGCVAPALLDWHRGLPRLEPMVVTAALVGGMLPAQLRAVGCAWMLAAEVPVQLAC